VAAQTRIVENLTLGSHEKYPFSIEMAGRPVSIGGFCCKFLSSAKNSSSKRCNETCAFATCKDRKSVSNDLTHNQLEQVLTECDKGKYQPDLVSLVAYLKETAKLQTEIMR